MQSVGQVAEGDQQTAVEELTRLPDGVAREEHSSTKEAPGPSETHVRQLRWCSLSHTLTVHRLNYTWEVFWASRASSGQHNRHSFVDAPRRSSAPELGLLRCGNQR